MKFIIGTVKVIVVIFGLLFIVALIAVIHDPPKPSPVADASPTHSTARISHELRSAPAPTMATSEPASRDYCAEALALERTASSKSVSNREGYKAAVDGLAKNEQCTDHNQHLVNEGYLLSVKGLREHYLPEGDSQTDLNQANALLVECQTTPGLYGTHIGAACETQEMKNIKATTNWQIDDE